MNQPALNCLSRQEEEKEITRVHREGTEEQKGDNNFWPDTREGKTRRKPSRKEEGEEHTPVTKCRAKVIERADSSEHTTDKKQSREERKVRSNGSREQKIRRHTHEKQKEKPRNAESSLKAFRPHEEEQSMQSVFPFPTQTSKAESGQKPPLSPDVLVAFSSVTTIVKIIIFLFYCLSVIEEQSSIMLDAYCKNFCYRDFKRSYF
ncbi:uncharacterized protein LOC129317526 [Prosopis cineraria]|uniref:uncharacterized protein LOC129317526 n=1 Tax=Prosopis cineraria TaxID=364024 RepID=UPI00240FA869|nr:uncharacterized protein LOC129317526 [Prosopis cineraria]